MSSQADPEAEKKEEADPANQAEVLHNEIHSLSVFPSWFKTTISLLHLS